MQSTNGSRIVSMDNSHDGLISGVGDRIKSRRMALGMSQEALALHADIAQGLLSRYEHGKIELKIANLSRIASVLGVSTDWLLGLEEDIKPLPDLEQSEKELLAIYRSKPAAQENILAMARML